MQAAVRTVRQARDFGLSATEGDDTRVGEVQAVLREQRVAKETPVLLSDPGRTTDVQAGTLHEVPRHCAGLPRHGGEVT